MYTIIVFEEDPSWIAQMLEKDICAQGKDLPEALYRLAITIQAEMGINKKMQHIPDAAPEHFFEMVRQ